MRRISWLPILALTAVACGPQTSRPSKARDLSHVQNTDEDLADAELVDLKKAPGDLKKPAGDLAVNDDGGTVGGGDLAGVVIEESDIRDIQNGSVTVGSVARVEGVVVTGVDPKTNFFFVQEPDGDPKYSGIAVYLGTKTTFTKPSVGDIVNVQGTVHEFTTTGNPGSRTDIEEVTDLAKTGTGALPAFAVIATPGDLTVEATAEPYEGVLVKIVSPTVTTAPDMYNEFKVTGSLFIDDRLFDYTKPTAPKLNDAFAFIEGPLDYNNGHYKILPRAATDMPASAQPLNLVSVTPDNSGVLAGATKTMTVTLSRAADVATSVMIVSSDPTIASPAVSMVTVDIGASTAKFVVNGIKSQTDPVTITASMVGSTPPSVSAKLYVNAAGGPASLASIGPATLTIVAEVASHGADERTGLIDLTLSGPAPAGGTLILLESKSAAVKVPDEVRIPEGYSKGSFRVLAVGTSPATATINVTDGGPILSSTVNVVTTVSAPSSSTKELVLNEVVYSPPYPDGDASCDGTRDGAKDEYLELVNISAHAIDLKDVSIWDDQYYMAPGSARYKLASYYLGPGESILVFGGTRGTGTPTSAMVWCTSPTMYTTTSVGDAHAFFAGSGLSLGNNGDSVYVTLGDKTLLDSVTWADGAAGAESWQRTPEKSASTSWVKHTSFVGAAADRPMTPGTYATGLPFALATPAP